jgi:hypothetical protein
VKRTLTEGSINRFRPRLDGPTRLVPYAKTPWMVGIAHRILFAFTVIVSMVLLILLLPAIVPVVGLSHRLYRKRLRAAARALACLSCGVVLGLESVRLADAAWDGHMRELRAKHPTIRFRVVRRVHAICPECDAHYTFLERDRASVLASMSPPAGQDVSRERWR